MTTTQIVIIVVAIAVAAALVWYFLKQERSKKLRTKFGPEYDHALRRFGSQVKAEEDLLRRQKRMEKIPVRPLSEHERDQFADQWHQTQSHFVDDPPGSIREADRLVIELMKTRGYPVADFEHRAADLSVDHPLVVRNYRAAHSIALRLEEGGASTEDLRQALVYYRDLFDELLEVHPAGSQGVRR
jgi:FtsZ-interacting cell division protein ZipA